MRTVHIWTDGSCVGDPQSKDPRAGAWAWIKTNYVDGQVDMAHSQMTEAKSMAYKNTNSARMEMMAVIDALESSNEDYVVIHSDSMYIIEPHIKDWIEEWRANGWKKQPGNKRQIENADLWERLYIAEKHHRRVSFVWVKAHNGDKWNTACDKLARKKANKLSPKLDTEQHIKNEQKQLKELISSSEDEIVEMPKTFKDLTILNPGALSSPIKEPTLLIPLSKMRQKAYHDQVIHFLRKI